MSVLDNVSKKELKEFLSKGWITHDAMWYYNVVKEYGIEAGNRLNLASIQLMSAIEVSRIKKILMTKDTLESFDELADFMNDAFNLLIPDFMKATLSFPEKNVIVFEWEKNGCFAYKGVKNAGFIDRYQCGVMHRVNCWYESLGIKYEMVPKIEGCLMHRHGNCSVKYKFFFEA